MIKNRMPLRNLLLVVIGAGIFLMVCLGYGLSIENSRDREVRYVMLGCGIGVITLSLIGIGIWIKKKIARVSLIVIVYILVIGWTILAGMWFLDMRRHNIRQQTLPLIFSFCMYCILFSLITFLNHPKLKEEFEIKNELGQE